MSAREWAKLIGLVGLFLGAYLLPIGSSSVESAVGEGLLLGTPESRGLVPPESAERAVGGNGLEANVGASVVGAFMYFATPTEVPIPEELTGSGLGEGPVPALLLAGPALSLPNMLVIRSVIGTRKTAVYVAVVVMGSAAAGMVYGAPF